jgi:hypothetical protein
MLGDHLPKLEICYVLVCPTTTFRQRQKDRALNGLIKVVFYQMSQKDGGVEGGKSGDLA